MTPLTSLATTQLTPRRRRETISEIQLGERHVEVLAGVPSDREEVAVTRADHGSVVVVSVADFEPLRVRPSAAIAQNARRLPNAMERLEGNSAKAKRSGSCLLGTTVAQALLRMRRAA